MSATKLVKKLHHVMERYRSITLRAVIECIGFVAVLTVVQFILYMFLWNKGNFYDALTSWFAWRWIIFLDILAAHNFLYYEPRK